MPEEDKTSNYSEHYARLEQIANQLSRQDQVDIDQLLPMVDEAMASYQFCKDRIDAVEKLLEAKLQTNRIPSETEEN
jgi:exodeoxyribonuclease VII small subunit